jgi:peptidoglycan/xylan/chitin deacetylase (PgdA/CDA1 family)
MRRSLGWISAGLYSAFGPRTTEAFGILNYHRMVSRTTGVPLPTYNVEPLQFEFQLRGLYEGGFRAWPLSRVIAALGEGRPLPPRTFVITFDDIVESVYTNAYPILRKLGAPATAMLTTAYLDHRGPFPFDGWGMAFADRVPASHYRPVGIEQCRQMQREGLVELGCHTHTHEDFRGRASEFRHDLRTSIERMSELFALEPPLMFALPFGATKMGFYGDELQAVTREEAVCCTLTTNAHTNDFASDPMKWGRFEVLPWDTAATLAGKLSGWYDWIFYVRSGIGRVRRRRPVIADQPAMSPTQAGSPLAARLRECAHE